MFLVFKDDEHEGDDATLEVWDCIRLKIKEGQLETQPGAG